MAEKTRGIKIKQGPKRVRVYLAGELVADTKTPFLVWEWPYYPTYYFPLDDVRAELVPAGRTEHSPSRGEAEIYHVKVAGSDADGAAGPGPAGLELDDRMVRGGRAGLYPPARPVQPGGHPGQFPRVQVEIDGV